VFKSASEPVSGFAESPPSFRVKEVSPLLQPMARIAAIKREEPVLIFEHLRKTGPVMIQMGGSRNKDC